MTLYSVIGHMQMVYNMEMVPLVVTKLHQQLEFAKAMMAFAMAMMVLGYGTLAAFKKPFDDEFAHVVFHTKVRLLCYLRFLC